MASAYDELLMDHIRNARNFRAAGPGEERIEAVNPLCGDRIELALRWEGERLREAAFHCECCGISMASSSILGEAIRGRTRAEAVDLCDAFVARIDARRPADDSGGWSPEQRALLDTAHRYPARAGCARLPWDALGPALRDEAAGS
jgi:nitrogen fixation NifU-like protein